MSSFTHTEKLDKLGEIFIMLTNQHQHDQAEIVQRVHSAMSTGLEIPTQDIQDLQTLTRFGLLQARRALEELQKNIVEATHLSDIVDDIYTDAQVELASREIEQILGSTES